MKRTKFLLKCCLIFLGCSLMVVLAQEGDVDVDRLTVFDGPVNDQAREDEEQGWTSPEDSEAAKREEDSRASSSNVYLTPSQWAEVERLIEKGEDSERDGEPMTVEHAIKLLGISIDYSPHEMLPLGPPGGSPAPTEPCPTTSIYSQPAHGPTDGWTAGTSDEGPDLQRFETYSVPADICSIRWWGLNAYLDPVLGWLNCDRTAGGTISDRYNIIFYPDNGGTPDLANPSCLYMGVTVDGSTLVKTATGIFYSTSFELYQYDLDLSVLGCCTLLDGWISIQGIDDGQNCWFLWMSSATGDGSNCLLDTVAGPPPDCGPPSNDFDLSLCLIGNVAPGACCNQDTGVCTDNPPVDYFTCMGMGANMRFIPGGLCSDFDPACGVATGACCFDDGSCVETTNVDCASQGGIFHGDGTSCTPNMCPQPCTCPSPISSFPYNEDFELEPTCSTTCGNACVLVGDWTNVADGTDDFDWTIDEGGTTSSSTGPSQDANPGTSTGNYAYTETSGTGCQNSTAILLSPCLDFSAVSTPLLIFGYHMYGADIGTLYVEVSTDSCISWTTELIIDGQQQGSSDAAWAHAGVDLTAYAGVSNLRVRFRGTTGGSFNGDMAIDDISLVDGASVTGACCVGATCLENVSQADCATQGGVYLGDFSTCGSGNPCVGACCQSDGSCLELTESDCISGGGTYSGGGTACVDVVCNDTCDLAEEILSIPFSTVVDNSAANADGPPGNGCNSSSAVVMQNDVWYRYTPTEDCFLTMAVDPDFGSGYDGIMQLYSGPDCNNLTPLDVPGDEGPGCFDDPEPYATQFNAIAGVTYWFQIGDWGTGAGGGLTSFDLTCQPGTFGACCLPDGTCIEVADLAACQNAGGVYQGDFVPCSGASCPQPCTCPSPINSFPYNEDFEAEATCSTTCGSACVLSGDWTNVADGTDDFDWTIDQGGTSSTSTGPSQDANPGTSTGNYAYTETSGSSCQNATALLLSPCYDLSTLTEVTLLFAYHMYGADIGDLYVEVSTDGCLSWTTEYAISGQQQTGSTEPWLYAAVDLGAYAGQSQVRVRFRGVTLSSFNGDMAVDDISVFSGAITGACCMGDGNCLNDLSETDCITGGGRWQGPFSDCADIPTCGGACCTSTGCSLEFQEDCDALGGIYGGDDTLCSGVDCNSNGIDDECDIASGTSTDCNENGIPDDCEGLDDCDGDGIPDICDPDCNNNTVSDVCDILNGTSFDCQPDGVPDECQLVAGAASVVITEVDLGGTDALEIQNVSGAPLDTTGWMVAVSDSPYSDLNTVNPIIQTLPSTMAADEIIYWTDSSSNNYWGSNLFWNPGDYPTFTGWAIILDDTGAIVDFAVWNGIPEAAIAGMSLTIGPYTVTIGAEWVGDGVVSAGACGSGFSVQRVGTADNNDATDWLCQATSLDTQNPGLVVPLGGGGGADCNNNGIPDDCDIADCTPGDLSCGDCNNNGVPDGCELSGLDCNGNGVDDDCDLDNGTSQDCNGNGIPDECDVLSGTSLDCNENRIPDECEVGSVALGVGELLCQAVIPDDNGVGPGLLLAIGSSCPFNNTSAEDFTLATSTNITEISWEGVYFGAASDFPGVDSNFHVTFYLDNGSGNVGAVVADFPSVAVNKALASRPPVFGSNPVYTYSSVLPAPVPVTAGQRYWLSINGDPAGAGGPVFGWMVSNEGNATSIPGNDQPLQNTSTPCASLPALTYNVGGDAGDQDADLAFCLFGDSSGGHPGDCNGNGIPDDCDIADGTSTDCNMDGVPDECDPTNLGVCNSIDVRPGVCPNPLNRLAGGYLPVGLLGSSVFDATLVDKTTVRLRRADGVGGLVTPNEPPLGPGTFLGDTGTPFGGAVCECHDATGDGIVDMNLFFPLGDAIILLQLQTPPDGTEVELVITGQLMDGTPFQTDSDCVLLETRAIGPVAPVFDVQ